MIISFEVTNFRSIQSKQCLSFEANGSSAKEDNVFNITLANGEKLRLLKLAGIYGANGSGKSNIIRAFWAMHWLLTRAEQIKIEQPLPAYEPFLFDKNLDKPTTFTLQFVEQGEKGWEKYKYEIVFTGEEILLETLEYYPKKKAKNIFSRKESEPINQNTHIGMLGDSFKNKKYELHKKMPLFSLFSQAAYFHPFVSKIYSFFDKIVVHNSLSNSSKNYKQAVLNFYTNERIKSQIIQLLKQTNTQIQDLKVEMDALNNQQSLYSAHTIFDQDNPTKDVYFLPFEEESAGTQSLFLLLGLILGVFEQGGLIIFDEIDTSLHPYLSRFLLYLFRNSELNPKNAQLLFTSHEVHLMDKEMRADQIWLAEKGAIGATDLYSIQDFEGIRENIAFDEWYLAGKFGALPKIYKYIK